MPPLISTKLKTATVAPPTQSFKELILTFERIFEFSWYFYRFSPYALLILPKCYRNHNATFAIDRTILSCHKIL